MLLKQEPEMQQLAAKNFKDSAPVCQRKQTTCLSASKGLGFPQDVMHWRTMLCAAVKETQFSFAKAYSQVRATFLDVSQPPGVQFPRNAMLLSMRPSYASKLRLRREAKATLQACLVCAESRALNSAEMRFSL
jgi:hypothetical protein